VIGLELGSVWRRLGAEVEVVEFAPTILPGNDEELVREADKVFRKQGLVLHTGTRVTGAEVRADGVTLTVEKDGVPSTLSGDHVLVSVGRKPSLGGVDAAALGLALGARGEVLVDDQQRTNLPGVYAIGDLCGGKLLAHKAGGRERGHPRVRIAEGDGTEGETEGGGGGGEEVLRAHLLGPALVEVGGPIGSAAVLRLNLEHPGLALAGDRATSARPAGGGFMTLIEALVAALLFGLGLTAVLARRTEVAA
jgi:hypothetical protein